MSNTGLPTVSERYPWLKGNWSFFVQTLASDRLAHALMIEGPSGTGKTVLARAMVDKLLCSGDSEQACGECRSCELLRGGAHPDFFELQPEEGSDVIKVDQVRGLISKLELTRSISQRKVAYIHPADNMNAAASNALLKSLEEPAGSAVLILVSHNPARLPITIRSRCQRISVSQPGSELLHRWLKAKNAQDDHLIAAAMQAAGDSPLRAEHYLQSPELDAYSQVRESLHRLLASPASVSMVTAQLGEFDATELWRWISMCAVEMVKGRMTGAVLGDSSVMSKLTDKNLLQLQQQADINRQLSTTPVRGDLLLQDWLIKWAEQVL